MSNFPRKMGNTHGHTPEAVPWSTYKTGALLFYAICGHQEALLELGNRFAVNNDPGAKRAIEDYHAAVAAPGKQPAACC